MHEQKILAIDTAMGACSVSAYNTDTYTSKIIQMKHGQAEQLMPLCLDVLSEASMTYADMDTIIATVGPGAFTGVRVGLSAARGLALALDIPLWGITTLKAMAYQHTMTQTVSEPFSSLIDTRRQDFYAQDFDANAHPVSEPYITEVEEPSQGGRSIGGEEIDPSVLIKAFFDQEKKPYFVQNPQPLYVRGADVSRSKKKQRVLEC